MIGAIHEAGGRVGSRKRGPGRVGSPAGSGAHPHLTVEASRMWETRPVQLNVQLPRDVAAEVEEVAQTDPEFLSRILLYGLTRRSIYRQLREGAIDARPAGDARAGLGGPSAVV